MKEKEKQIEKQKETDTEREPKTYRKTERCFLRDQEA